MVLQKVFVLCLIQKLSTVTGKHNALFSQTETERNQFLFGIYMNQAYY